MNETTKATELELALCNLLEWAKGNRGARDGNPYSVPEVKAALQTIARERGMKPDAWMDVETVIRVNDHSFHGIPCTEEEFLDWLRASVRGKCPFCGQSYGHRFDAHDVHIATCPKRPNPQAP